MRDDPAEYVARDQQHVWHPYAPMPSRSAPECVVSAKGVRLTLADGRELVDGMSSWWSAIHGYNHPELNSAALDQLSRMSHVMFGGLTHPPAIRLAEELVRLTPGNLSAVFFSDSGSVAIEVAAKMAVQYWQGLGQPERRRFLSFRGGYHGDTQGAMALSDPTNSVHHLFAGILPHHIFAPRPAPAFDQPFEEHHIAKLTALLERHAHELAGVVIEPVVQGAGGMWFYSPRYLAAVRELCDRFDVLLIVDEIATGFGRTGRLFACEHAGIAPDILCLGKALTGGYLSMAATLCTREIADGVSQDGTGILVHGPTFMGNPLAAALGIASISLLCTQPWAQQVGEIEQRLAVGLSAARDAPGVADVRVLGAIGVIETHDPIPDSVQAGLVAKGIWLRPFGHLLYTMPPYLIGEADLDAITDAMVAEAWQLPG
jgi:adenosylmethionine-8-amino-7-oxononanoate aminotransferase